MKKNVWETPGFCDTGSCIEVQWVTPEFCESGHCVEVGVGPEDHMHIRDGKLGDDSPVLTFSRDEFRAWVKAAKNGQYDNI